MTTPPTLSLQPPKPHTGVPTWVVAAGTAAALFLGCCTGFALGGANPPDPKPTPDVVTIVTTTHPAFTLSDAPQPAPSPTPPAGPTGSMADGVWEVGVDIQPGKYKTVVPATSRNCYWERMRDFSGALGSILDNDNHRPGESVTVVIAATDKGFKSSGCGTWARA